MADLENLEKLVEQINDWASASGKAVYCIAHYLGVIEHQKEEGVFIGVGDKSSEIDGYTIHQMKTAGEIVWNLPGSLDDFLAVLEQIDWQIDWWDEDKTNISYDDMNFDSSRGISSDRFDNNDNEITKFDDFESSYDEGVIFMESKGWPTEITVTYENDQKVVFDRPGTDNWTVKIADGNTENVPDYQAALLLIRTLLGK